jgi:hypothetical protein
MPVAYLFWTLMILWVVLGLGYPWIVATPDKRVTIGGNLLLFALLALLGYQAFGSAVK